MQIAVAWIVAALVFVAIDAVWLSQMSGRLYRPILGEILAAKVNFVAAIAFYLIYISGVVFFAVIPALDRGSLLKALSYGAFLGFFAYGVYDLTNQATLRVWDWRITLIDMVWGTFLTSMSAAAAYFVASKLN